MRRKYKQEQEFGDSYKNIKSKNQEKKQDSLLTRILNPCNAESKQNIYNIKTNKSFIQKNRNNNLHELPSNLDKRQNLNTFKKTEIPIEKRKKIIKSSDVLNYPNENKVSNISNNEKMSSTKNINENYYSTFVCSQNSSLINLKTELDNKKSESNLIHQKIIVNKYSNKNIINNNERKSKYINKISYSLNSNNSKPKEKISVNLKNNLNNNNQFNNNEIKQKNSLSIISEKISFLNSNDECESLTKQKMFSELNNNANNSINSNNILNKQDNSNRSINKSFSTEYSKKKKSKKKNKINSHVVKQKKYYNITESENAINNKNNNISKSKENFEDVYNVKFIKYNPLENKNEIKYNTRNIIIKPDNNPINDERRSFLIDRRMNTSISENNYSYDNDLGLVKKQCMIKNKKFYNNNYNYYINHNPKLKIYTENKISNSNNISNIQNSKKNTPKNIYINNIKNNNSSKIDNNSPSYRFNKSLSNVYKSKTTKNLKAPKKRLQYESNNNENQNQYYSSLLDNSFKKRNNEILTTNQKYLDIKKMILKEENLRNKEIHLSICENSNKVGVYKNAILSLYKPNLTLPQKPFKFLLHEVIGDKNIKDSFCKYYNLKKDDSNSALSMSYRNFNSSLGNITPSNSNINNGKKKNGLSSENLENEKNKAKYYSNRINYVENNNEFGEMKKHKTNLVKLYKKATGIEKNNNIKKNKTFLNNSNNHSAKLTINNLLNSKNNTINGNNENTPIANNLIETSPTINNIDDFEEIKNTNKNIEKPISNRIVNNNTYNTTLNIFNESTNINNKNSNIEILKKLLPHNTNIDVVEDNSNKIYNDNNANLIVSPILTQISGSKICDIEILNNLENKILLIIKKIDKYKICKDECYDYINFYFSSNIYEYIIKLFNNNHNKNNIINYIKLELLCYFLCYDLSFNKYFNQAALLIKSIIKIIHENFLLIIKFIISEYFDANTSAISERSNGYLNELKKIILEKLTIRIDDKNIDEFSVIQIITDNTKNINNYYIMILENLYKNKKESNLGKKNLYRFPNCIEKYNEIFDMANKNFNDIDISELITMFFFDSYRLLNNYNIVDLKKFFDLYLDRQQKSVSVSNHSDDKNKNISKKISKINKENSLISLLKLSTPIMMPGKHSVNKTNVLVSDNYKNFLTQGEYLPDIDKNKFKYTLVIELNEVLFYLNKNKKEIVDAVIYRQGMINFLSEMKRIYEIIIFSYENSDLVENIVKDIQKDEKYFEYVLGRQYGIEENGIFYKDLNLLNRDEKNIIIVDIDKKYYYEDWKKNCICIKPFLGDIKNDKILNNLCQLLRNIKYDAEFSHDIRLSLNKYKKSFAYSKIAK